MLLLRAQLAVAFAIVSDLAAHGGTYLPPQPTPAPGSRPAGPGGQYRGPGDTTPGGGGPSGPRPLGPSGPTSPGPAPAPGPETGGTKVGAPVPAAGTPGPRAPTGGPPNAPANRGATTRGSGGVPLEADYDSWDSWWEFNKDRFLQLRAPGPVDVLSGGDDFYLGDTRRAEGKDLLRPGEAQLVGVVLPALRRAILCSPHRDIASACLVAMAKVGIDDHEVPLLDLARPLLRSGDQEIRETAALAIGIRARADGPSLDLLEGLALDDSRGRAWRGGPVDERLRAFAAYGLGLTAQRCGDVAVAARAFVVLRQLLAEPSTLGRDVRVAAIQALGLLAPQRRSLAAARLVDGIAGVLDGYFVLDLGVGEDLVQAHCPTALAKVVGRDGLQATRLRDRCIDVLRASTGPSRRSAAVAQSCTLALGRVLPRLAPGAPTDDDGGARETLLRVAKEHPDRLTRHFALVALAQAGGQQAEEALLTEFVHASQVQRKAWAALALGILVHEAHAAAGAAAAIAAPAPASPAIALLHAALREEKEPGLVGALGIALGLCGATEAADTLRARLGDGLAREKMAGYLCVGLALLQDRGALGDVRRAAGAATRRPDLLVQAAVALGRLGDRAIVDDLLAWMKGSEVNLSQIAALSTALARIGDRRSIPPLIAMLEDRELGTLPRAFAAVALGGICDPRPLPWNTPIAIDCNYRAAVPTMSDQMCGVLDIL